MLYTTCMSLCHLGEGPSRTGYLAAARPGRHRVRSIRTSDAEAFTRRLFTFRRPPRGRYRRRCSQCRIPPARSRAVRGRCPLPGQLNRRTRQISGRGYSAIHIERPAPRPHAQELTLHIRARRPSERKSGHKRPGPKRKTLETGIKVPVLANDTETFRRIEIRITSPDTLPRSPVGATRSTAPTSIRAPPRPFTESATKAKTFKPGSTDPAISASAGTVVTMTRHSVSVAPSSSTTRRRRLPRPRNQTTWTFA